MSVGDALPVVTIVGLGPGGDDHVTTEARSTVEASRCVVLRTAQHPNAHLAGDAIVCDDLYDAADRFHDVYTAIVERVVAQAHEHGAVTYVVPGSPLVLERTVAALCADPRVETRLLPAMSFLDVVWARLGIDPIEAGVRLVDGHAFTTVAAELGGAVLIAHTHANWVISDIKISLDDPTGALDDTPVIVLQAVGTDVEQIVYTTWSNMDRAVKADHLTSVFIPRMPPAAGAGYVRFNEMTRRLRAECPWDREQTHQSLEQHLIEETYELLDAIAALDPDDPASDINFIEELGDLLFQIELHTAIAAEEGRFTMADVTSTVADKMERRHPHVFGDISAATPAEVSANWEAIKAAEKPERRTGSIFAGVPGSLPALSYARAVQHKAAKVGFDWPNVDDAFPKIAEETAEVADAIASGDEAHTRDELGDLLFAVVNVARHLKIEPEAALRQATTKFRRRFEAVEQLVANRQLTLSDLDLAALDTLWDDVKAAE